MSVQSAASGEEEVRDEEEEEEETEGEDEDDESTTAPVALEPFLHQVGGHFPMVTLDEDTVCKPLNDREHKFYRTLPAALK